jgi:hypothetical protein|tara:strand:- start:5065 stop:5637 length:573 start_codon:yes stop_codon:yes gene_type:complete
MKKHIINIPTNNEKIYKQILSFMNFLMGATPQERDVIAELVVLNREYEALPVDKRAKFILSTDMRKEIREKLDIEEKQFNGLISRLKKIQYMGRPVLSSDGVLNAGLIFEPDSDGLEIQIKMSMSKQPLHRPEKKEIENIPIEEPVEEKTIKKEEPKKLEETAPRKLAPPANGTDTIIGSKYSDEDITIL